jgi:hypothetical protein
MAICKNADGSVTVGIIPKTKETVEPGEKPGLTEPKQAKKPRKKKQE